MLCKSVLSLVVKVIFVLECILVPTVHVGKAPVVLREGTIAPTSYQLLSLKQQTFQSRKETGFTLLLI